MADDRYDVIVVGTGFGGAISACRLAEAGARVLILERGRRWTPKTYPREAGDPWLYHHRHPEKHHGWLDLRFFRGMAIAQGAGVGGGSLCYSSVVMEADADRFDDAWPPEITLDELKPYYEKVRKMLRLQPIPANQRTHRFELLRRGAEKLGYGDRFEEVPLAIAFDPDYSYDLPDPIDARHAKRFVNDQGVEQHTCVHLGNCDIGCDVHAKNTLDLNYVASAESHGAELRTLHLARWIEPVAGDRSGYKVVWDEIRGRKLVRGSAEADRVILAAGSLGSTEILLRSRDDAKTLPKISLQLGQHWSANANFLTPAVYPDSVEVNQGIGPTISAGLNFMDGSVGGERFYVEDDGFPNLLLNAVTSRVQAGWASPFARLLKRRLERGIGEKNPLSQVMVWLGEGIDAADGRLELGRRWLAPWKKELKLHWDSTASRGVIDQLIEMHGKLSDATDGRLRVPFYWRVLGNLVTVHPLGGCALGRTPNDGVADHTGQVFGYPNLYVADGALLPRPTGRNPSMTIGALSERVADLVTREG